MRGNALRTQGFATRRATAAEYHDHLIPAIMHKAGGVLLECRMAPVLSYRNKPDFGDTDMVLESNHLSPPARKP